MVRHQGLDQPQLHAFARRIQRVGGVGVAHLQQRHVVGQVQRQPAVVFLGIELHRQRDGRQLGGEGQGAVEPQA